MNNYITTIGEIADIFDGPHATPQKTVEGPYYLSISSLEKGRLDLSKSAHLSEDDFKKWTKRVIPREGDILFSYETRIGEVALMPEGVKACLGRRMGLLRVKPEKVLPKYLLYAYLSPEFQRVIASNTITGATVDRILLTDLHSFNIRIPPLDEQIKVSDLLSALDEKIELNTNILKKLYEISDLVFEDFFINYNYQNNSEFLNKEYLQFNTVLKKNIPSTWSVEKLSSILKVSSGFPFKSSSYEKNGKFKIVTIKNVKDRLLDLEKLDSVVDLPEKLPKYCQLKIGDILISLTGNTGRICIVDEENLLLNQRVGVFECEEKWKNFLYYYFHRVEVQNWLQAHSNGSSQKNLSPLDIVKQDILLPSDQLLENYNKVMDEIREKIIKTNLQIKQLKAMRNKILPGLMSGRITL